MCHLQSAIVILVVQSGKIRIAGISIFLKIEMSHFEPMPMFRHMFCPGCICELMAKCDITGEFVKQV